MHPRQLFLNHLAQTSEAPLMLEINRADGCWLFGKEEVKYLDLISGISVCNIGHNNATVIAAIEDQIHRYLHVMVYGEFVETPQVLFAEWLVLHLPANLNTVYFTNSGSEAVEGALKLAKRVTGRTEIVSFTNSYHGSTMGALSAGNNEERKNAFRPLIPHNTILNFNNFSELNSITNQTACVLVEPVQAEAGVIIPAEGYIDAIRKKCDATGALLIFDECQTGFGRTGTLFHFEQINVIPDVLVLGKALGGGMPLGAFIADKKCMHAFTNQPILGHLTTFGGHPVCCAAGLASAQELKRLQLIDTVKEKSDLIVYLLQHASIHAVRSAGLMVAIQFENAAFNFEVNKKLIAAGFLVDWFLFAPDCLRLAPPLLISEAELRLACSAIISALDEM